MATQITNSVLSTSSGKSAAFTATGDVVVVCNVGAVQVEISPDSGTSWFSLAIPASGESQPMFITDDQAVTFLAASGYSYRLVSVGSKPATASAYQ